MTEHGARILAPARKLLRDSADFRGIANDAALAGELRLGACATAMIGLLPPILARMSSKFPQIKVFPRATGSAQVYEEVEAGHLDAALVLEAPFPLPKTCDWRQLREEPLIVLAPHRLAGADAHAVLTNEPFIRYDRNQWGGRHADEYLRACGIRPREKFELNGLGAIAVMVDRGLGVTLVPD